MPGLLALTKGQFFLSVIVLMLLPFIIESEKGVTIYNPQRVMCQFGYDQIVLFLSGDFPY